jgi:hypothetical protein
MKITVGFEVLTAVIVNGLQAKIQTWTSQINRDENTIMLGPILQDSV